MSDTKPQNCENADGESRQVEQIVRQRKLMPKYIFIKRNILFYTGKKQFKNFAACIGFLGINGKEYKRKWWRIYLAA